MTGIIKGALFTLLLGTLSSVASYGTTRPAASCSTSDVQTAINSAAEGDTVTIPAGTCTWTAGVTIAGKGITVAGAGSGRIVAYSALSSAYSIGSGSKSIAITGFSPGFTSSVFTTGSTVKLFEDTDDTNVMTGTVTGYSGGTLTLNVSSASGSCGNISTSNCKRWLVGTVPSSATIITNSSSTNPLFSITEDTSVHTKVGNIQFLAGNISQNIFIINYAADGQAVLLHDMWMQGNSNNPQPSSGNATMILGNSPWRGVVWNCSFDAYPYTISGMGAISVQDKGNATNSASWTTASTWGSEDTTGQSNFYAETNDYHGMGYATSTDDSGRMVARYSLYDNAGFATHGADTSNYGQRYFELYENTGLFEAYTDGTTFNFQGWVYLRGGTFVIWGNTFPDVVSQDWGTKLNVNMTVMNLQRNQGPDPCWGTGFKTAGQYYHAPRQVGFGYVTGLGNVTFPTLSLSDAHNDSMTYVGDSEPGYIWGNSTQPFDNVGLSDYGTTSCTNPDSSSNYIISGRDYFNTSTAKPGYTPYTYPHPLTQTTTQPPAPPTNVQAVSPP